jgi:hypothetical protein
MRLLPHLRTLEAAHRMSWPRNVIVDHRGDNIGFGIYQMIDVDRRLRSRPYP